MGFEKEQILFSLEVKEFSPEMKLEAWHEWVILKLSMLSESVNPEFRVFAIFLTLRDKHPTVLTLAQI